MEIARVRSPEDLAVLVPYLLGFQPQRSFVLLGMRDGRLGLTQRMDLVPPAHAPEVVRQMIEHAVRAGATRVVALAYESVAEESVPMHAALHQLVRSSVIRCEASVVVRDGRWYDRTAVGRRASRGELLPDPSRVPAVAAFVAQGRVPLPSREALRDRVSPGGDPVSERVDALLDESGGCLPTHAARASAVRTALHRGVAEPLEDEGAVADLVLGLRDVLWRDALLATLCPGWLGDEIVGKDLVAPLRDAVGEPAPGVVVERLCDLVRAVPRTECAAVLTVLGQVAWSEGEGALAIIALEEALEVDPGYRLAQLLERMVSHGLRLPTAA